MIKKHFPVSNEQEIVFFFFLRLPFTVQGNQSEAMGNYTFKFLNLWQLTVSDIKSVSVFCR